MVSIIVALDLDGMNGRKGLTANDSNRNRIWKCGIGRYRTRGRGIDTRIAYSPTSPSGKSSESDDSALYDISRKAAQEFRLVFAED